MKYLIALPLLCLALAARAETEHIPCSSDLFTGKQLKEKKYVRLDVEYDRSRDIDIVLEINQMAINCTSSKRDYCLTKAGDIVYSFSTDPKGISSGYMSTFIEALGTDNDGTKYFINETYFCTWHAGTQNGCRRTCNFNVDYPPGPDHD